MRIIPYSVGYKDTWDTFLQKACNGTFLLSRGFLDYHAELVSDCSVLVYAEDAMTDDMDQILGVDGLLALFPACWRPEEKKVYTHFALGYSGLIQSPELRLKDILSIIQAIFNYYANYLQVDSMVYAPLPYIYSNYPNGEELYSIFQAGARLVDRKVSMVVPLKKLEKLPMMVQGIARKAIEKGLYIERMLLDSSADHEKYVSLLGEENSVLSLSSFSHSNTIEHLQELMRLFPRYIRYFVVKNDEGVQAGCMLLVLERVVYIHQLVCSEYGRANGAVELLLKHLTQEHFGGVEYLDMGSSYKNEVLDKALLALKENFGGKVVCYDTYEMSLDQLSIRKIVANAVSEEDEKIPYLSLKLLNDSFEPAMSDAIMKTVSNGRYLMGSQVSAFEQEFAKYCGAKYCVGVGNGLEALQLILMAYKEKEQWNEGDEVIVPANTFIASILAIRKAGLTPVLCEPSIEDSLINCSLVEPLITDRTRAIMPVHLYGRLCDMVSLRKIADAHNLRLIEDSAQAHGAYRADGERAGHLGDASGFSFYPGKNLGALGDAGCVVTDDEELARIVRMLGNYGSEAKYVHDYEGMNSRMDEVQATVLRTKLARLDADNDVRRALAKRYAEEINNPLVVLPQAPRFAGEHVYHIYSVRCLYRDELRAFLQSQGIETLIHYPIPPHKQKAFEEWNDLNLPITEKLHREVLSLPLSPALTDQQVSRIVKAINEFNIK